VNCSQCLRLAIIAPFFSDLRLKTDEGFCWGLFCMCAGFHCPISVLFDCYNGAAFPSGELHSFLGFLSRLTELVGIHRLNNVAKSEIMVRVSKCPYFFQMLHIHNHIITLRILLW
jgi:hypothetical protein